MIVRILQGDCRDVLATLPDESVHMVCTSPPYYALRSYLDANHPDKHREIGSEKTPDEYLATMVAVFREVRRVLRSDGTLWLNIGDSYNNFRSQKGPAQTVHGTGNLRGKPDPRSGTRGWDGAKEKDLLLMPARLALALQADGWYVRSDIIWAKPNPMPESVTDRPTNAYEHVFLLTKSARYFYDGDAVREPYNEATIGRYDSPMMGVVSGARKPDGDIGRREREKGMRDPNPAGRNLRNVWTIAASPFPEAHFATFPPELAERCIRAGTSERGCCAACGKPWSRITKTEIDRYLTTKTTGWQPGCRCRSDACDAPYEVVPCTVLDPFAGAFTTALVADRLQRDAIGIELNEAYVAMARARIEKDAGLFADITADGKLGP